jgi:drug/metabolite transporter (DMT)-like permease
MGITFLGESLTPIQALAVLPILGGVLLTQLRPRRRG